MNLAISFDVIIDYMAQYILNIVTDSVTFAMTRELPNYPAKTKT